MFVGLKINGIYVEAVDASSVKLTITNVDPIGYSEKRVSYSGTIRVGRTSRNDVLFKSECSGGMFKRNVQYLGEMTVGGFPAPINYGLFRARVTFEGTHYNVIITERFGRITDMVDVAGFTDPRVRSVGAFNFFEVDIKKLLEKQYGYVSMPAIATAGVPIAWHKYWSPMKTVTANQNLGQSFKLVNIAAYNKPEGGCVWTSKRFEPDNREIASLFTTVYGSVRLEPQDCVFRTDDGGQAVLYFHALYQGSQSEIPVITFLRESSTPVNGVYTYRSYSDSYIQVSQPLKYFVMSASSESAQAEKYAVYPTTSMTYDEAVNITLRAAIITGGANQVGVLDGSLGASTVSSVVQEFCKVWRWRYAYDFENRGLVFSHIVNPGVRNAVLTGSTEGHFLIDWEDKLLEKPKTTENDMNARLVDFSVGDLKSSIALSPSAFNARTQGVQSSAPVRRTWREKDFYILTNDIVDNNFIPAPSSYFYSELGYLKYMNDYYSQFKSGVDYTVKARLSYFDIRNLQMDAGYRLDKMNVWSYLRSVSNWSPATGECTLHLTQLSF